MEVTIKELKGGLHLGQMQVTTGWLGRLIQSPGHHQIHHSTNPAHHDRNLGFCLSVWDWAFGTLCIPERGGRYDYGLGEYDRALQTLTGSMLAPFKRATGRAFNGLLNPKRTRSPAVPTCL